MKLLGGVALAASLQRVFHVFSALDSRLAARFEDVPDAHRFDATELALRGAAPSARFELLVPRLEGMRELRVRGARFVVRPKPVELPLVTASGAFGVAGASLLVVGERPPSSAALRSITVRGLSVAPGANETFGLNGHQGAFGSFSWSADAAGKVSFEALTGGFDGGNQLHLLVQPRGDDGAFGPPTHGAPHFTIPSGLYDALLGGVRLRLGAPESNSLTLEFDQPLVCTGARLVVALVRDKGRHGGFPDELQRLTWSADEALGVWESSPAELSIEAHSGGPRVPISSIPGVAPSSGLEVSFLPAARSLLNEAYKRGGREALPLAFDVTCKSEGVCSIERADLAASYVAAPLESGPLRLELRGAPEFAQLALPRGLTPRDAFWSLDGRFGPGLLLSSSDTTFRSVNAGHRLEGARRVARRFAVGAAESVLPMMRIGLFGRASRTAELLVRLHAVAGALIGAPLGPAHSLLIEPSSTARWHRLEFEGAPPPNDTRAVWIVAQVARGVFRWSADPARTDEPVLCSDDGGSSWNASPLAPLAQLHARSTPIEPAPIRVHAAGSLAHEDLLLARGARTLLTASREHAAPDCFRIEQGVLLERDQLARVQELEGALELVFSCARDVDLSLLQAEFDYDPWGAGPVR